MLLDGNVLIEYTKHFEKRMRERNINKIELQWILNNGFIRKGNAKDVYYLALGQNVIVLKRENKKQLNLITIFKSNRGAYG